MRREILFATLGKNRPAFHITFGWRELVIGVGLKYYSDWTGIIVYFGPLQVGIGIDSGALWYKVRVE